MVRPLLTSLAHCSCTGRHSHNTQIASYTNQRLIKKSLTCMRPLLRLSNLLAACCCLRDSGVLTDFLMRDGGYAPTYKHEMPVAMKLAKSARGILQSLRPQQTNSRAPKVSKASQTVHNVVLTTSDKQGEELEAEPVLARLRKARRPAAGNEEQYTRASARPSNMGQPSIAIHEDARFEASTDLVEVDETRSA